MEPRERVFDLLEQHRRTGRFVDELLDRDGRGGLAEADGRFATELLYGIVRRRATLAALLAAHVARPRHRVEAPLWTLLQIGAYQIAFMESVPPHAAVHETVELAGRVGKPRWKGFVNGVLRSLAGELTGEVTDRPRGDALPLGDGRFRVCRRPMFPEPDDDPSGYFAKAFSFPAFLAARWSRRYDLGELVRLGFWFNSPGPLYLRVNRLRVRREELLAMLQNAGIPVADPTGGRGWTEGKPRRSQVRGTLRFAPATRGEWAESIRLEKPVRVDALPGFREGLFTVQDTSAMHAAALLDPRPGWNVLDLCAAPGTKTTHLAELMTGEGCVLAADVRADRLKLVEENCRRLGIGIVEPRLVAKDGSDVPAGPFDAALVDVPCTNTGVLGKRPDARWRIGPKDLRELPDLQCRLLLMACRRVRPGGRAVYSTCSIEPEENAGVVRAALGRLSDWSLVAEHHHQPGRPADGGYQALLCRC